jgi:hypothetical protein
MILSKTQLSTFKVNREMFALIKENKVRSLPIISTTPMVQIIPDSEIPHTALICKVIHKEKEVTHFKKAITLNYVIK